MTHSASSKKINQSHNLFGYTFKKSIGFTALASILALIISPFYIISEITDIVNANDEVMNYDLNVRLPSICCILAVLACAFFVVLLIMNFGYLYNKSASDIFHSLPITRRGLVISRFGASYICSVILLSVGYIGLLVVSCMKNVDASISSILVSFGYSALMMLMCGAFVLITIISSGTAFDSVVGLLGVNIGIPVIALLVYSLCDNFLFGFVDPSIIQTVKYSSPFIYSAYELCEYLFGEKTLPLSVTELMIILVLTILFFAISSYLYNRRKSEMAGTSYAFGYMPAFLGFIVSFISYFILSELFSVGVFGTNWVAGTIGALLGGAVYNTITNRGFKKIKTSVIISAVALVAILCVNLSLIIDVFGYGRYVPKENDIISATVEYQGAVFDVTDIKIATNLHKEVIRSNFEENFDESNINMEGLDIRYMLKNGKDVNRSYNVPCNVANSEKTRLITTYLPAKITENFNKFEWNELYFVGYDPSSDSEIRVAVSRAEASALINAYVKDVKNAVITPDWNEPENIQEQYTLNGIKTEISNDKYGTYVDPDHGVYYQTIRIHKNYVNTIECIKALGLKEKVNLFTMDE